MFEFKPNRDSKLAKNVMDKHIEEAQKHRLGMLEMLAAAYLKQTSLDPREVELVEEIQNTPEGGLRMVWYFRKRGETK